MRLLTALLLALAVPVSGQELVAYMEPGFPTFSPYRTILEWPAIEVDSFNAWDGVEYVVPVDGIYTITLQVWVEGVVSTPTYLGAQVWRGSEEVLGWDAELVESQYGSPASYAATLHVTRAKLLTSGDRIHVEFFTDGAASLSGYPHESWLSIIKH